ncbi:CsgG/HfaB family protein [Undibacterium sp.]|jgi:curli biogenesis system outer membrane secretion channel CsgG|uniref:CsgG/HfaB family protein n=1 Tax=Undibacterium sp. TaxID=1914977 RepID=UPI002BB11C0E|nr:CsgG/HfaB family protein [Undibacterium sp.]HTD03886.1 CsgG/HfaB family protein [Undibacterium sp.]
MKHPFAKTPIPASLLSFLLAAGFTATSGAAFAESVDKGAIEKCNVNLGTLAVAEPQSQMLASLSQYSLGSPSTMLRMIVQESGCFTVVERGVAMQNLQQERALAAGGQLQEGSNLGGGQLQAADFVMTPSIQFSSDTGGVSGVVGGLFGKMGGALGAIGGLVGGVKFKEAETTLLVADVRSGIQVASAEGQASKMNFSLGGWGWGGLGWASAGGYSKTPEGKLIAASLLDNFNKIVLSVRDRPQLIQTTSTASKSNAAQSIRATGTARNAQPGQHATNAGSNSPQLPGGYAGMYTGKFVGDDNGSINVLVSNTGNVTGMGMSKKYNASFNITGTISATGEFVMAGSGQAGAAKFIGNINPQNGGLMGVWQWAGASTSQGTFSGQRQ